MSNYQQLNQAFISLINSISEEGTFNVNAAAKVAELMHDPKTYDEYLDCRSNKLVNKFKNTNTEENICSICLEENSDNDYIETKCKHIFHKKCMIKLVRYNISKNIEDKCPNCRAHLIN